MSRSYFRDGPQYNDRAATVVALKTADGRLIVVEFDASDDDTSDGGDESRAGARKTLKRENLTKIGTVTREA